jgi:hypothetical protein
MELDREAGAGNIEYGATRYTVFPVSQPKLFTEGSNRLAFASTEEGHPDFNKEVKIRYMFDRYQLDKGDNEALKECQKLCQNDYQEQHL